MLGKDTNTVDYEVVYGGMLAGFVVAAIMEPNIFTFLYWRGYAEAMNENMVMTDTASWQDLYQAAMLEIDLGRLHKRIELARAAIENHREGSAGNRDAGTAEARRAMADALATLRILHRVELKGGTISVVGSVGQEGGA